MEAVILIAIVPDRTHGRHQIELFFFGFFGFFGFDNRSVFNLSVLVATASGFVLSYGVRVVPSLPASLHETWGISKRSLPLATCCSQPRNTL